jgi:hypothetical protein
MVRHDDETAAKPTVPLGAVEEKGNEALEGFLVIQDASAAIHAYRQKVGNVAIAVRPDAMQTAQAARRRVVRIGETVWGHTAYSGGPCRVVGRVP